MCGGGRYDNLINQMGGPITPSIGFAVGLERLMILAGEELDHGREVDIYIVNKGLMAESFAMNLSRKLRNYDLLVELDLSGASFSKQFKKANKLGSKSIVIIGDEEASKKEFLIRLFKNKDKPEQEQTLSINDDLGIEKWIDSNLIRNL